MNLQNVRKAVPYIGIPVICAAFAVYSWNWLPHIEILLFEALLVFGYIVALEDLKTQTVPNMLLLIMLAVWAMIEIPLIVKDFQRGLAMVTSSAFGALIGGGAFFVVYVLSRKGLGAGDVKFMTVAGLYLGMNLVLSSMLMGSLLSAVTGVVLLCLKKIKKTDAIPLVPFLYAGIVLTVFLL